MRVSKGLSEEVKSASDQELNLEVGYDEDAESDNDDFVRVLKQTPAEMNIKPVVLDAIPAPLPFQRVG
jgi:hypothetical protein